MTRPSQLKNYIINGLANLYQALTVEDLALLLETNLLDNIITAEGNYHATIKPLVAKYEPAMLSARTENDRDDVVEACWHDIERYHYGYISLVKGMIISHVAEVIDAEHQANRILRRYYNQLPTR